MDHLPAIWYHGSEFGGSSSTPLARRYNMYQGGYNPYGGAWEIVKFLAIIGLLTLCGFAFYLGYHFYLLIH